MSNEIKVQFQMDETDVYACVFNSDKQVFDIVSGAFETWDDAQVDRYDVPLSENGGGGIFYGDFPSAIPAGKYEYLGYQGDKTMNDTVLGGTKIDWNGISEVDSSASPVISAGYVGDYQMGDIVYFDFSTTDTLAAAPTVRVYKDDASTPVGTPQVSLTVDGAETNVHTVSVTLTEANYDRDSDYTVVISGVTIGGVSVSAVIGLFSVENRYQEPVHRHVAL